MQLKIINSDPQVIQEWPRLMRNKITLTIFLVPSLDKGAWAIELCTGVFHKVQLMEHDLEWLPNGFSITLTNT